MLMKKTITAITFALMTTTASADSVYDSLQGVGLNSIKEWSSCNNITYRAQVATVKEYKQVFDHGWDHIVIVQCAQNLFPGDTLDETLLRKKFRAYRNTIEQIALDHPNATWVVSFKGYDPVGKDWNYSGIKATELYQRIETSDRMQDQFIRYWQIAAEEFRGLDRVAFNLMNEPEFTGWRGKSKWFKLATRAIDTIRDYDPSRWIIVEGIHKSLVGRGKSPSSIMKTIDRPNIIYGFHYYGAGRDLAFDHSWMRKNRLDSVRDIDSHARKSLNTITRWGQKNGVPTALTETGLVGIGYTNNGLPNEERARFARDVLTPWHKDCGCGISWWALGDTNTPYFRVSNPHHKSQPYPRKRDDLLFDALELK